MKLRRFLTSFLTALADGKSNRVGGKRIRVNLAINVTGTVDYAVFLFLWRLYGTTLEGILSAQETMNDYAVQDLRGLRRERLN